MEDKKIEGAGNSQDNVEESITDDSENLDLENKSEAKLTQSQVDKIVRDRLARAKRDNDLIISSVNSQMDEIKGQVDTYEKYFNQIIGKQLESVPDAIKDIFNKLSLTDKLDWLSKHASSDELKAFDKQNIPSSPKSNDKQDTSFKPNTKNVFKM